MAVGDRTADSVIWSPGAASGYDSTGALVPVPSDNTSAMFGSGAPSGSPHGLPIYVNTANHKLYVHDGSVWVPVSGFNT